MSALSIKAAAREVPRRDALIVQGQALSYDEVAQRVDAVGEALAGFAGDDVLALTPQLDLSSLLRIWACLERGVPMLLLHPRLTVTEREEAVRHAALSLGHGLREWPAASDHSTSTRPASAAPADVLAYLFTSGTTGAPRAVRLSRRAFLAAAHASEQNLGWRDDDRWMLSLTPAHVGGLSILVRALVARRAFVLADLARFEPAGFADQLERDHVTLASLVPTMLRRLLDHDPAWYPPSALRAVLLGGAASAAPLLREACARGLPILTSYGMTETCAQVVTQRFARRGQLDAGVGHALPGVRVRVRDGRIELHTPARMDGYLGVSAREQPFTADDWLRTADAGALLADGSLDVHGRCDDIIVSGGENVAPWEVEGALLAMAGVKQALVFAEPDEEWGQRVCVALTLAADGPDLKKIAAGLRQRLAPHKLPRWVALLPALPVTPKGDIDRPAATRAAVHAGLSPWPRISPP